MHSPRSDAPREEQVFFIDRSLGRYDVPGVFRRAGHPVVLMCELYPDGADQRVPDDQWIAEVSSRGWIALTKDIAILRRHREALERSTLRLFALDSSKLRGDQMAERFQRHIHRIIHRARHPGPYVYVVHHNCLERRWAP